MEKDPVFKIQKRIEEIGDLPTLPDVALKVTNLVNDPDSNVSDVVAVIRNDSSLTSKILKVANSAFYGMRRRIESLNMALVILGMREINSLVTAISVFDAFPSDKAGPKFDYHSFWLHSACVGEIAKYLGRRLGFREESSVFTGGLLHDIGKIILSRYFTDDFIRSLEISLEEKIPAQEAENRVFNTNHAEIGAWLAERWGMPDFLVNVLRYHHDVANAPSDQTKILLVHLADHYAHTLTDGSGRDSEEINRFRKRTWKMLMAHKPMLEDLNTERLETELETEIENARDFLDTTLLKE